MNVKLIATKKFDLYNQIDTKETVVVDGFESYLWHFRWDTFLVVLQSLFGAGR